MDFGRTGHEVDEVRTKGEDQVTSDKVFRDLDRLISEAAPSDRPGLVVALGARIAHLGAGLVAVPDARGDEVGSSGNDGWITPEEAAAIAKVPKRRIYEWARGRQWAHRPSRRCLRISRTGFGTWLASRP